MDTLKNPYEILLKELSIINKRLDSIQNVSIPKLGELIKPQEPRIVDLNKLIELRPQVGSKSTVYKNTANGIIPHCKRGKRLLFELEKIDTWLLENEIATVAELEQETFDYLTKKGAN